MVVWGQWLHPNGKNSAFTCLWYVLNGEPTTAFMIVLAAGFSFVAVAHGLLGWRSKRKRTKVVMSGGKHKKGEDKGRELKKEKGGRQKWESNRAGHFKISCDGRQGQLRRREGTMGRDQRVPWVPSNMEVCSRLHSCHDRFICSLRPRHCLFLY